MSQASPTTVAVLLAMLAPWGSEPIPAMAPDDSDAARSDYGRQRVVVAHFKFPGTRRNPFPIEETRGTWEKNGKLTVKHYFEWVSGGKSTLDVDYLNWRSLDHGRAYYQENDPYGLRMVFDAAAIVARQIDLHKKDKLVLILQPLDLGFPGCGAFLGPKTSWELDGEVYDIDIAYLSGYDLDCARLGRSIHELGHTFGFHHTSDLACLHKDAASAPDFHPESLVDPEGAPAGCDDPFAGGYPIVFSYGSYDVMGGDNTERGLAHLHLSAPWMYKAGWVPRRKVKFAKRRSGRAVLAALDESRRKGKKALVIPFAVDERPDLPAHLVTGDRRVQYWIEYRDASNPDPDLHLPLDRVLVRLAPVALVERNLGDSESAFFESGPIYRSVKSRHPLDEQGAQALRVGDDYHDPYRGIRIVRQEDQYRGGQRRAVVRFESSAIRLSPEIGLQVYPGQEARIELHNESRRKLAIDEVSLAGASPGDFEIVDDACSERRLKPRKACSVLVALTSDGARQVHATLRFSTRDALRPHPTLALIGTTEEAASAAWRSTAPLPVP